jgi:DNA-binding IclR family transcriptional regulator
MRSGWLKILRTLRRLGKPTTAQKIADALDVDPSTVRTLLDRSRTYGTVRLAGKDGRFILYEITDVGTERLEWEDRKP